MSEDMKLKNINIQELRNQEMGLFKELRLLNQSL